MRDNAERGTRHMEHDHSQHPAAIPAQMPPESQLADVAELFKIFGDLTRVRIIFVLFQHEECVRDIAQKLEMTQSAISHQLRVLKQSRLVVSRREGKPFLLSGGCAHFLHLRTSAGTYPGIAGKMFGKPLAFLHGICYNKE